MCSNEAIRRIGQSGNIIEIFRLFLGYMKLLVRPQRDNAGIPNIRCARNEIQEAD